MNFEDVMLSEISQSQKDKYFMTSTFEAPREVKVIENNSRMVTARDQDEEEIGRKF